MTDLDLSYLRFLAQKDRLNALEGALYSPHIWKTPWAADWKEQLSDLVGLLEDHSSIVSLLHLNVLSAGLLRNKAVPQDAPETFRSLSELRWTPPFPTAAHWVAFPVPVGFSGSAEIRYFIAGLIAERSECCIWPDWALDLVSTKTREAVQLAVQLSLFRSAAPPGTCFCVFPLVGVKHARIQGRSIGLPAALAFDFLSRREPYPVGICATGELSDIGTVSEVNLIPEKVRAAALGGFHLFLYPHTCSAPPTAGPMDALPVQNVGEALLFTRLHSPGKGRELLAMVGMQSDPCAFVTGMDRVDPDWVNWVGREHGWDRTIDDVLGSGGLFRVFARNLQDMTADYRLKEASAFMQLVTPERLTRAEKSPVAALTTCTAGLSLSNHLGDIESAEKWARIGGRFLLDARRADLDACVDFLNNRMVLSHNRYRFDPALTPEIEDMLALLRQRRKLLTGAGCLIDRKLGELLGTITQNYGFCGPAYIDPFLRSMREAEECFGRNEFEDTTPDCARLVGYSVYAYLDAAQFDRATAALYRYTVCETADNLITKAKRGELTAWQHAAVARVLSSPAGEPWDEAYLSGLRDRALSMIRDQHPWQLWANNLGRIAVRARDTYTARLLFQESLRICRLPNLGPTVRLMSLLPLSGLLGLDCLPPDLPSIEQELLNTVESIDHAGFHAFLEIPIVQALEPLRWKPEAFFLFTYR
jgi:hypothetical protein